MSSSTPTGPPPSIPPVKPILSTPGSYMSTFQSATIHSINKTHDKPIIAARPVFCVPPVVPKYASSQGKIDRSDLSTPNNDRVEREKVWNETNRTEFQIHCSFYYRLLVICF